MITPTDIQLLAAELSDAGFPDAYEFITHELVPMADQLGTDNLLQTAILYAEFTAPLDTKERQLADALNRMATRDP